MPVSRSTVQITVVTLICLLLSGCMVKLVYNNLDRLVRWQMNDFIDMTSEQRAVFDEEFEQLWYWHRTTQLPQYADMFETLAADLEAGPPDSEGVQSVFTTFTAWGDTLEVEMLPLMVRLLASLDDEQVEALAVSIREDQGWRDTESDDVDGQRAFWVEQLEERFERLMGRLTREQRDYIVSQATRYQPEQALWEAYIEAWQDRFLNLLAYRTEPQFAGELRGLVVTENYGSPLEEVVAANEQLSQEIIVTMLGSLTDKQQNRLIENLEDVVEDFRELVAEAKAPAA